MTVCQRRAGRLFQKGDIEAFGSINKRCRGVGAISIVGGFAIGAPSAAVPQPPASIPATVAFTPPHTAPVLTWWTLVVNLNETVQSFCDMVGVYTRQLP